MATLKLKAGESPDEFCDDGITKKLNKTRPFGTVYCAALDEWKGKPVPPEPAKFLQDGKAFTGDGIPVGYVPAAQRGIEPVLPPIEELAAQNEDLKNTVKALLDRVAKLEGAAPPKKGEAHAGARSA